MSDWIGAAFLVFLAVGAILGIRALANPKPRTADDFERSAAEGTTLIGATLGALQDHLSPQAARAREVKMQLKEGRYGKKKREGKAGGDEQAGDQIKGQR